MKALFNKGQIIQTEHERIEILKVYKPGHIYASNTQYFYLINSSDIGQDNVPENILTSLIK